jgi:hypothetical protein
LRPGPVDAGDQGMHCVASTRPAYAGAPQPLAELVS